MRSSPLVACPQLFLSLSEHQRLLQAIHGARLGPLDEMTKPRLVITPKPPQPSKKSIAVSQAQSAMTTPELRPQAEMPSVAEQEEPEHQVPCDSCQTWRFVLPSQFETVRKASTKFYCRHVSEVGKTHTLKRPKRSQCVSWEHQL